MTTHQENDNLDYIINLIFRNIKRLFVRSFKNGNNDPISNTFDKHCMLLVEIKDFDALIDNKLFFDRPSKKKQEEYENLVEMSS